MSHEHFVMLHKPEDTSRISRKTINFEWFIQHSYQIVLTNDNLVIVSIHSDHVENRLVQSIIATSSIGPVVLENAATASSGTNEKTIAPFIATSKHSIQFSNGINRYDSVYLCMYCTLARCWTHFDKCEIERKIKFFVEQYSLVLLLLVFVVVSRPTRVPRISDGWMLIRIWIISARP